MKLQLATFVWISAVGANLLTAARLAAAGPSDLILPDTTIAFASSANLDDLISCAERSQLGRFWNDATMKGFVEQVRDHPSALWARAESRAGIRLGELRKAAFGEVSIAAVEVAANEFAAILLAGCGDESQAKALMSRAAERLRERGASPSHSDIDGTPLQAFRLPDASGEARQTIHFCKDGVLGVASDIRLAKLVLSRWPGQPAGSLSSLPSYRDVMERSRMDATPQLRWFCVPVKVAKRLYEPDPELEGEDDPEKAAKRHGVDAVGGIGGCVSLKAEGLDLLHRTSIYAPPPLKSSMGMMSFPSGGDLTCLPWIPSDVSSHITLRIDLLNAFDHCSALFDDLVADGLEGTFEEFLNDLKAEDGPQVDLRKDLVAHLGNRAAVLSLYRTPVSETSEGAVAALEVKDEQRVASVIERLFRDDPGATQMQLAGYAHPLWKIGDDETVSFPEENSALTSFGVMVAQKHLLVATDFEFIQQLLGKAGGREQLADSPAFQRVMRRLEELGDQDASLQMFSYLGRDLFTTYEMLRLGKAEDADSICAKLASTLFSSAADTPSNGGRIDFGKLAPFDQVKHYFGCAGVIGKNHDKGWLLEGFFIGPEQ